MRTTTTGEQTDRDVIDWRRDQLVHTGFPLPLAGLIAKDRRYDLHALIELVEQGCQPELAARILAPLESESAA
jgi:hypothetical protein